MNPKQHKNKRKGNGGICNNNDVMMIIEAFVMENMMIIIETYKWQHLVNTTSLIENSMKLVVVANQMRLMVISILCCLL